MCQLQVIFGKEIRKRWKQNADDEQNMHETIASTLDNAQVEGL